MKSCPGCEFLIDDGDELCEFCAADPTYASRLKGYSTKTVVGALADSSVELGGSVGVLERPVPNGVNWSETDVTPKSSGKSLRSDSDDILDFRRPRRALPVPLIVGVVAVAVIATVFLSVTGRGPLADEFAKLGLSRVHAVVLPGTWRSQGDIAGQFKVELPVGWDVVFEQLDPTGAVPGGLVGSRVEGSSGTYMFAGSSDLGIGPADLKAHASDEGVAELAERFAAARVPGKRTVSRSQLLNYGYVNDSVYVSEAGDGTVTETRLRVILSSSGLHELITSGPESAASELDAAHQRLVTSFSLHS